MKALLWLCAVAAIIASVLLSRIVLHGYTDHGHLDTFHLFVAIVSAMGGMVLMRRAATGSRS